MKNSSFAVIAVLSLSAIGAQANPLHDFGINEEASGIQDRIAKFVGPDFYRPLNQLDQIVPLNGKTKDQPWSGSYWPLFQGGPARPYMERGYNKDKFQSNFRKYLGRLQDLAKFSSRGSYRKIDLDDLSPTEKYDLYLGDMSFGLSRAVWQSLDESDKSRERHEHMEDWEGMCHGWAPASAYSPRPTHPVSVTSLDGRHQINFFPDDIKALSTLLWANSLVQDDTILEGVRCKTNFPNRDRISGKVTTLRCKGVNPAIFHLSTLGLVGQKQMSFIINKNNDEEVWNQPVAAYHMHYFNPNTGAEGNLASSTVAIKNFTDPFSAVRSPKAVSLVGVDMVLDYASETDPSHQMTDGPEDDTLESLHVRYDLELDQNSNVLGGEWIDEDGAYGANSGELPNYPAFMWRFRSDNPFASSIVDAKLAAMGPGAMNSSTLTSLSRQASSFRYTRYAIDEDGELDVPVLNEDGTPIVSHRELRPQPIAWVVNMLQKLAH